MGRRRSASTFGEVNDEQKDEWSPAKNPYAIAVSQSWWAIQALLLFVSEARNATDHRQQIYARQIFGQLRLLRLCARMQADELESLGVSKVERDRLNHAMETFDTATPDAMAARNMLEHFDDYARGKGTLQKRAIRDEGMSIYEAAAVYWGGGYNPATEHSVLSTTPTAEKPALSGTATPAPTRRLPGGGWTDARSRLARGGAVAWRHVQGHHR
jgi:hypothetical protein